MRVFATKAFTRFARKFGVSARDLWDAATGEPDADLGGGVFKFRLARKGEGSSGGARSITAMKKGERVVMMFGFEKKDLANIDARELRAFRKLAGIYLGLSDEKIDSLVSRGELTEFRSPPTRRK